MRSYFDGMVRYFEFAGRSTRLQYWMFFLIQALLFALALVLDFTLGDLGQRRAVDISDFPMTLFISFIHVVPGITVQVRRLHDIGKSGAWYLLHFVPLGGLVLLYWACCALDEAGNYEGPQQSSYRPASRPKTSTIPQGVRMGNGSGVGARQPMEGRFI